MKTEKPKTTGAFQKTKELKIILRTNKYLRFLIQYNSIFYNPFVSYIPNKILNLCY